MARIAVTGIASFLGSRVLRRLVETRGGDMVVAVDIASPPATLSVRHREIDFTEPVSDQRLLDVFREEDIGSVFHAAFFTNPRRDGTYSHELESIGTLNLLAAAAAAGVGHVVQRSFTAVYGARGQNPTYLTENRPLQPNLGLGWVRDKLEAEQHAAAFARRYPAMTVTVLRFAPLLGPGVHTFYTSIFDKRIVPVPMGYDPVVQLLHPDDAVTASMVALDARCGGAFNIVPKAPIALLTALHLAAKIPVPIPHLLAYPAAELLWASGVGEAPAGLVDYVRFGFMADGDRARAQLGFSPAHSSRDSLTAYLGYRFPRKQDSPVEAHA